jgi:SWI/SNF-related matrix-associated actin-dependent regulator 1 of chromatin subfamily A
MFFYKYLVFTYFHYISLTNMLDLSKLKNRTVLLKLKEYDGPNEYIHRLRINALNGKVILTQSQVAYINDNYTTEPIEINRVIEITPFFGEQLEEKWELKHTPERILVETLLAESDKAYHIKGKLYKNQKKSELYFVPKTQVNTDLFEDEKVDIDVDFIKYKNMDHYLLSDGTTGRTAFKYQEDGIKFLLTKKKCVLADDMGLGKTYQSIVAALETDARKVLVVCPANAKINWKREISNFIPEDDVSILKTGHWDPKRFTIINYDILKNFHTLVDKRKKYEEGDIRRQLVDNEFDLIILDEAHMVKNPKSQRTKIINEVSKNIERRWLLTGTPIANRPMDYFNLLHLCDSPLTANWQYFAFRYCAAKKFYKKMKNGGSRQIWLTDGASNLEELHNRTKKYILRRVKEDHLDLPPKLVAPYYLEMDDMRGYNSVFDEYLEWAKSEGRSLGAGRHMVELGILRKFISLKKVEHSIEIAQQAVEQGKKVIIFTSFTDSFNALMSHFGRLAVGHNGKMNGTQKQSSIDNFQNNDKVKIFVGNLISAGTAITLTAAEVVIMNDLDFVPANHAQAEDRAYRIGQDSTVNVYYPIFEDTVDIMMYEMLQKKKQIIGTIMGEEHEEVDISKEFVKQIGMAHKFI